MMNNIKFYNMHRINCWIINLRPFDPKETSGAEIRGFQERCVQARVFGIGWRTEYFDKNPKAVLDEATKGEYKKSLEEDSAKNAVDGMSNIKSGDPAIMRLRDGHIYLGRVTKTAFHDSDFLKDNNIERLSWICAVEKWLDFGDESVIPSEISGRFFQKQQKTVIRIILG